TSPRRRWREQAEPRAGWAGIGERHRHTRMSVRFRAPRSDLDATTGRSKLQVRKCDERLRGDGDGTASGKSSKVEAEPARRQDRADDGLVRIVQLRVGIGHGCGEAAEDLLIR